MSEGAPPPLPQVHDRLPTGDAIPPDGHGEEDGNDEINGKKRRRPDQRQHPTEFSDRRTLFLINLPRDVTSRELYNMLYFFDGFCKVQLYEPNPKSTETAIHTLSAFALFESQAQAMAASARLHGHTFDPTQYGTPISSSTGSQFITPISTGSHILQVRLANKNLIMTKEERESANKRPRTDNAASASSYAGFSAPSVPSIGMGMSYGGPQGAPSSSPYYLPPTSVPPYGYGAPTSNVYNPYATSSSTTPSTGANGTLVLTPGPLPVSQHPPGTTLFLARMGQMTPAEILNLCVSACPHGFRDHKITTDRSGQRVAFVQYDTIEHATQALQRIHGYQGTVGAFSKNPLGVKRDFAQAPMGAQGY